jgi:hypothetical protein
VRNVIDRRVGEDPTFADLRTFLAGQAACLWFRHALEEPALTASERASVVDIPSWPGIPPADDGVRDATAAVLDGGSGGSDVLRRHLIESCGGSAVGLGLAELGGWWLAPQRAGEEPTEVASPGGVATAIDPASVPRWDAIAARLGDDVVAESALALPDGAVDVRLTAGSVDLSLTIGRLRDRIALPVDEAAFDRGFSQRDGIEVFVGTVDGTIVAHAVGADGASLVLTSGRAIDDVEAALGAPLADLVAALHRTAWPR